MIITVGGYSSKFCQIESGYSMVHAGCEEAVADAHSVLFTTSVKLIVISKLSFRSLKRLTN